MDARAVRRKDYPAQVDEDHQEDETLAEFDL